MKLICMYAGSSAEKHTYTVHQSITGRKTGRNVNATVAANIGGTRKKDRELDGRCPRLASPRLASRYIAIELARARPPPAEPITAREILTLSLFLLMDVHECIMICMCLAALCSKRNIYNA